LKVEVACVFRISAALHNPDNEKTQEQNRDPFYLYSSISMSNVVNSELSPCGKMAGERDTIPVQFMTVNLVNIFRPVCGNIHYELYHNYRAMPQSEMILKKIRLKKSRAILSSCTIFAILYKKKG
jgi:hypothetical protein